MMWVPGRLQLLHWLIAPLALALVAQAALAAEGDNERRQRFNDNMFAAGSEIRVTEPGLKDVFAAGETVTVDSDVRETAHAAGREVRVNRPVGRNVYAFGFDIDVEAPVGADVIAAGYRVQIGPSASVAGDVVAAGRTIALRGPVMGDVSLTADTVEIAAPIAGSAQIRAREIRFAEGARIGGTLSYTSRTPVTVPANVIPPERITATIQADGTPGAGWIAFGFTFLLLMLGLTALFAFLSRDGLVRTRAALMAWPWRDLLLGIVAMSALFGSIIVLAVSLIGIPLIPLIVLLIPFVIIGGYLTTAHAIGALIIARARATPGSFWAGLGAILLGVLILAVVTAIPLLGWVIAVIAVIVGIGAWMTLVFTRDMRVPAR